MADQTDRYAGLIGEVMDEVESIGQAAPEPLSDEQLAAIEQRADGATKGPWSVEDGCTVVATDAPDIHVHIADMEWLADTDEEWAEIERNAAFVAAAREDVPALLREVRRLRGDLATLRGKADRYVDRIEVLARKHRRAVALRSTLRHLIRVQKQRGDDALAEVRRLRAERDELEARLDSDAVEARETGHARAQEIARLRGQLAMHLTAWRHASRRARASRALRKAITADRDRLLEVGAATVATWRERAAYAEAERDRLAEQVRALADAIEPAPDSAPEDRWDRGSNAALRTVAQQLRTLIAPDRP